MLFIEYDPLYINRVSGDARQLFDTVQAVGYEHAVAWDNFGAFLLSVDRSQFGVLRDLHHYVNRQDRPIFVDIALFPDGNSFEEYLAVERLLLT